MSDELIAERLHQAVDHLPVSPPPTAAVASASRRRRRRHIAVALVPALAAAVVVSAVTVAATRGHAERVVPAASPQTVPPPALAAPDANTIAYFSPYDWFERPPANADPRVTKGQAIAIYRSHLGEINPVLWNAPITAVLGVYHQVTPRHAADGTPLPGTASPPVLAWAVVQGPSSSSIPGGAADAQPCWAATAINAATGNSASEPTSTFDVQQDCSVGVMDPIIRSGRASQSTTSEWGTPL